MAEKRDASLKRSRFREILVVKQIALYSKRLKYQQTCISKNHFKWNMMFKSYRVRNINGLLSSYRALRQRFATNFTADIKMKIGYYVYKGTLRYII